MTWLRRLYDWVLHWAETPHGATALFALAFTESMFFPVPPDVLLIALALGNRNKALWFALICSVASLLGGMAGYALGHFLWLAGDGFTPVAHFFFNHIPGFDPALYHRLGEQFEAWGFVIIFTAGFTPIPYKVFTISAGAFDVSFPLFVLASAVSRTARFLLVAGLIWRFGAPIRAFIDRYFNLLAIAFTALLIGGFVLVKYVL
ncbi:DedA family protein [Rhodocaloribacter litoris]|uniref:YqaA family protein n=1 Tax=Rhodocaloribacter litoris TaxID=2558931 RepID=UPI001423CBDE|nr:YqaA family protein [Rhodocaloribacter litoris]QXD13899.1 DedA family protein [Rhodocaloribacter litoris]